MRHPTSHAQKRILLFELTRPGSPAYNVPRSFDLTGDVDVRVLGEAFSTVVAHHPALRHRFHNIDGEFFASVEPADRCVVDVITLAAGPDRDEALARATFDVVSKPFDTANGPLYRVAAVDLGQKRWRLIAVVHHSCVDDSSFQIIVRDWQKAYEALLARETADLRQGGSYEEFVAWEGEFLASASGLRATSAAADELRGATSTTLSFTSEPPDHGQGCPDERTEVALPPELLSACSDFARAHGGTIFILFCTALAMVLRRHSGADDLLYSIVVGNRPSLTFRETVGVFINTAPIRVGWSEPSFLTLFEAVKRKVLLGVDHQAVPVDAAVGAAGVDVSTRDLLSFMLVENLEPRAFAPGDVNCAVDVPWTGASKLPVTISLTRRRTRASHLRVETDRRLFGEGVGARIAAHLLRALAIGLEDATRPLDDQEILTEAERGELERFETGAAVPIRDASVCLDILEHCARSPSAPALIAESPAGDRVELTYGELDRWSGSVAAALLARNVPPGTPVGVMAHRSVGLPATVLGILRAGCAYLPLDPDYPDRRLAQIIAEADPALIFCSPGLKDRACLGGRSVIDIDAFSKGGEPGFAGPTVDPGTPAYVIYTSGSTGRPKGVINLHRGLRNRLDWMQAAIPIGPADVVLQKTPISFDVSVWELIWPLMHGASMVLARPGGHKDVPFLEALIAREAVTTLHFVPSLLRLFVEGADAGRCRSIKHVISSGESLPQSLVAEWLARFSGAVYNLYGPTEAAIDVTFSRCAPHEDGTFASIGRPIHNTSISILDGGRRRVPVGAAGEIYIGGLNVAAGYLAQPDRTRERFVWLDGQRSYRTGDLARWDRDGRIHFLGRQDGQIKLHGVRIELDEIDDILCQHPRILDGVVSLHRDGAGDEVLVAHVVTSGEDPDLNALSLWLRERMPSTMVPTVFRRIDEVPRSVSGKVDRNILVDTVPPRGPAAEQIGPQDRIVRLISDVVCRVLAIDTVGLDSDFYVIGVDSLKSLRIAALLRTQGVEATIADILASRSVRGLAQRVERLTPSLRPATSSGPEGVTTAFAAPRLVEALWQNSQVSAVYRSYVTTFHIRARLDVPALRSAVERAVARHAILRTRLLGRSPDRPRPMMETDREACARLELQDLAAASPGDQDRALASWIDHTSREPWPWDSVPSCRFIVHERSGDTFQFTLLEPWLDGWSVQVLASEIFEDYIASITGRVPPVRPRVPLTYANLAADEEWALRCPEHRAFWSERLRRLRPNLVDFGREISEIVTVHVPLGSMSHEIRDYAHRIGAPIKSVLLASHLLAISTLTGHAEVSSGVMFNSRQEVVGAESILGLYLNALPVSVDLRGRSVRQVVDACISAEVDITPWRLFPSDELRVMYKEPLFDTLFNFTDFRQPLRLSSEAAFQVLGRVGYDQTYMALCTQFGVNLADGGVTLDLEAASGLVERIGADRLGRIYSTSLRAIMADAALDGPGLWSFDSAILAGWSGPEIDVPREAIFDLFHRQAQSNPQAEALRDGPHRVTFRGLAGMVNRMSERLVGLGVRARDRVGICVSRSTSSLAAVLACLRLRAAFVPLATEAPVERLAFIARDAGLRAVVSDGPCPFHWAGSATLDLTTADPAGSFALPPVGPYDPDLPISVLYTSGSTNRPKGVETCQAAVLNRLHWMWNLEPIVAGDVMAHKTALSFVDSVWEMFGALLQGASTAIVPAEEGTSVVSLAQAIHRDGCTRLSLVPSVASAMLHDVPEFARLLRSVKVLILSGEALHQALAEHLIERLPDATLLNLYGATETAGDATFAPVRDAERSASVIGRPLPGVKVSVLDESGRPVPIGVRGEITVGGACLARRYVGWAARDAEEMERWRVGEDGRAMWRTGDLGYWRQDGQLVHTGRRDRQLKVRGVRLEPGEIEGAILREADVRRAVATVTDAGELVAFVESPRGVSPEALRKAIGTRLPSPMVPSRIAVVPAFPETLSGKIAVAELVSGLGARDTPAGPGAETALEALVIDTLREVFPGAAIGRTSDFFALGGHSLLAGSFTARLRKKLKASVPMRLIFDFSVVSDLAVEIEKLLAGAGHLTQDQGA